MIESDRNKRYCQSCGMPLRFDVEEWLGSNPDGTKSDKYCYYCLKEGKYTIDISMPEMVDIWVKYADKYNMYSNTQYSPDELRALLQKRLPTLKRWKQKQCTTNIHYQTVQRIIVYLQNHLFDILDVKLLSSMSGLSPFYFRRVFQSVTGENIGKYVQRLRLEYVAHLLVFTEYTLTQIVEETNYETKFSLAKAFKKHFGIPASQYREKYKFHTNSSSPSLTPEIKMIPPLEVFCIEVGEAYKNKFQYKLIWDKLLYYSGYHKADKPYNKFVSLSLDDPSITPAEKCRFYLGLTVENNGQSASSFHPMQIPKGRYAVFRHTGSYGLLCNFYRKIYEEWFPLSPYRPQSTFSFEMYMNTPADTETSELITDAYIPIAVNKGRS